MLNLSQEEFAKKLGISRGYLANIEKGLRTPPDRILRLISHTFGVSYEWLKYGKGEMWKGEGEKFPQDEYELMEWVVRQVVRYLMHRGIKPTYKKVYRLSEIVYKRIKPLWEEAKEKIESERLFKELEESYKLYEAVEGGE